MFIASLKFLEIDTFIIEEVDDIENHLEVIKNMFSPTDILNSVSNLIDTYFDNNIMPDEAGDINILRYEKFQNFLDNTKWLENNKDVLKEQCNIVNTLSSIVEGTSFIGIADAVQCVKDQLSDILYNKIALDNWKNIKYENNIKLDQLQSNIDNAVEQYNSKYEESHNILNIEKNNLITAMDNNENIPLIKSLEQINFVDVRKLTSLEGELGRIKTCDYDFRGSNTGIFICENCGDLEQIITFIDNIRQKQNNVGKELYKILKNYMREIDRLVDLNEVKTKYNRNKTIIGYVQERYPGKLKKVK